MNIGKASKRILVLILTCLLAGTILGIFSVQILSRQEYQNIAQLLGAAEHISPQIQDDLIQALKSVNEADFVAGDAILQQYHYSTEVLGRRNTVRIMGFCLLLMLLLGITLGLMEFWRNKKVQRRIQGLTGYLKANNLGQNKLLSRKEDEFSLLEDEMYKTVTELWQSRETAMKERQSLADNLADISHQLKTPLTSMSLMTQLLADNCDHEKAVYVEKLNRQLNRLETLVSSLLTLSKLDTGAVELKHEKVNVCALLTRAAEPIEDIFRQRDQQLLFPPESEISFMGDAGWSAEAFLNLLKNCNEHTPPGGSVRISCAQNPLYTEIVVEDSGTGFEKDQLPHIFERFYKGRNAAKDSIGIGLSLAKTIIEKQNGLIRAENSPGGGARFIVKFYA